MNFYITTRGCAAEMRDRNDKVVAHAAFANEEHAIAGAKSWAAEVGVPYVAEQRRLSDDLAAIGRTCRDILNPDGSPRAPLYARNGRLDVSLHPDSPEARLARLRTALRVQQAARREADEAIADTLAQIATLRRTHGL